MPFFAYKGRNIRGELVQGVLETADSGAVADQLLNNGITPIDIVSAKGPGGTQDNWRTQLFKEKIKPIDIMLFSRQMHTLLKAGVPILRSLAGLQESTINKAFAQALSNIRESLDAGRELSAALRRLPEIFSPFYVSMVRVGETTGMLEEIFLRLYRHLEFEKHMRDKIRAAIRYPLFVIIAMAVALVVINIFVIPAFAKVYAGFKADLPFVTEVLIGFSNFMVRFWPLMLVALVALYLGFRIYTKTPPGRYKWDKTKLRLPIAGKIIMKATLARFARSFALTMRSGIPVVQGLSVVAQVVDNTYMSQRIEQMRDGVERGESILRTATTAGVFSSVVLQMVAVGEETGELDELMREVAEMYQQEVEYEVENLSAQIEPILIVALGIMVLILALGVFLPMWDLGRAALGKA